MEKVFSTNALCANRLRRSRRVIFSLVFFFSFPFFVQAEGISFSPAFQEVVIEENESSKDFSVEVTNEVETPITFRLSALDFGGLDESGGVAFVGSEKDLEKKYGLASWLAIESETVTLLPRETKSIKITLENRADFSPGGHYAGILFRQVSNETPSPTQNDVAIEQIFSTLVFVKKRGGEIYGLELESVTWPKNIFSFPSKGNLRFKNTGNVHVVPRGSVHITDPLGRTIAEGILNEESSLILPESFRSYEISVKTLEKMLLFPGHYTLTFGYRYDGKDAFERTTERFYFIPLPAILIVLLLLGGGTVWYAKKRGKNTGDTTTGSSTE